MKLPKDNNFCLPDLTSEEVTAQTLTDVESFKDNPIAVIYQSGYLTIKDCDEEFNIYRLGFPNKEVTEGFIKVFAHIFLIVMLEASETARMKQNKDNHYFRIAHPVRLVTVFMLLVVNHTFFLLQWKFLTEIICHTINLYWTLRT